MKGKGPMFLITTKIEWVTGKVNNMVLYVNFSVIRSLPCNLLGNSEGGYYLRVATIQGKHLLPPRAEANLQASLYKLSLCYKWVLFPSFLLPMTSQVNCPPCLRKCQTSLGSSQGMRPTICSPFFMTKASKYCPTVSVMRFTCYSNSSRGY